jgi:HlyD family secretion protein
MSVFSMLDTFNQATQFRAGPRTAAVLLVTLAQLVPLHAPQAAQGGALTTSGTLDTITTATVGVAISGVIQDVTCDFNTIVKKGQVCARIDPRPFQKAVDLARANLAQSKALLDQHQATLTYVKANFERSTVLVAKGIVSKDSFENVQSNFGQARAQIEVDKATIGQRQAELELAELNLGYTSFVSPIDGIVLSRMVKAGEVIAPSQPPILFVIGSDPAKLQLRTSVGEGDVGGLKTGDTATFSVPAFPGRTFPALISQIRLGPDTQRGTVVYGVVLDVDNAQLQLKPGMTADVRFNMPN